jgi:hypothetical protein
VDSINVWIHRRGSHYHVLKSCKFVDLTGRQPYEERKVKIEDFMLVVTHDGMMGRLEFPFGEGVTRRYAGCPKCMYEVLADAVENSLIENIIGLQKEDKC